jgi:hypothetical protein
MRASLAFVLVAGVMTAVAVGAGVLTHGDTHGDTDGPTPEQAPFSTTPLAGYDTTTATVSRAAFCADIDDRQVDAVLGSVPDVLEWKNGDEVDLSGTGTDVVHEFGCRYAVQDVGTAQAWVFAPPVDAGRAARLAKSAEKATDCQVGAGPPFGSPTLALTCTKDGTTRASYRGLFGDAWLVCEVERPTDSGVDVADAAGRWCVGVLEAVGPDAGS